MERALSFNVHLRKPRLSKIPPLLGGAGPKLFFSEGRSLGRGYLPFKQNLILQKSKEDGNEGQAH
jgi:hypothetical protein